jgi:hypothetical protein
MYGIYQFTNKPVGIFHNLYEALIHLLKKGYANNIPWGSVC